MSRREDGREWHSQAIEALKSLRLAAVGLARAEKNGLFKAIQDAGIDPGACDLVGADSDYDTFRVRHRATDSIFQLDYATRDEWVGSKKVGTDPVRNWTAPKADWGAICDKVWGWVRDILEYEATPDLWAQLASSGELAAIGDVTGNELFTQAQQAEIAARIDEVKVLVRETFELGAGQLEGIDEKLDNLKEAGTRLGRKDWVGLLYGAAFGMIVNDAVPPNVVQSFLAMVVHGLAHIFGFGAPPPPIPT
jgi:hypothetical protein